jgi:CobQ/CobB/MinD/ParA nucleotide binding domain
MKILAIVSEKGGAGKTTLAVNLAVAAEAHGLATAIFDLDPRANSTVWGDRRETKIPAVVPAQGLSVATWSRITLCRYGVSCWCGLLISMIRGGQRGSQEIRGNAGAGRETEFVPAEENVAGLV